MPTRPSSHEELADIERLTREIPAVVEAEIGELATADDAHIFDDDELKNRALALEIAADAVEARSPQS